MEMVSQICSIANNDHIARSYHGCYCKSNATNTMKQNHCTEVSFIFFHMDLAFIPSITWHCSCNMDLCWALRTYYEYIMKSTQVMEVSNHPSCTSVEHYHKYKKVIVLGHIGCIFTCMLQQRICIDISNAHHMVYFK